ncbi:zinc dependent phospholipase C family protein [Hymenobacter psychrophilus]|uniref:S1/P1 Nuclease n=1 Tax=Hymenobacter psychrophilus TaxID=651662 RepID=A0A1H3GWH0_9BACT|nr:zinc dependent phospholipase C family protein [Hymenobacter psychrophilus]SDY07410.1 hypothetical protein SAMN04488069_105194 [Hymenobacter psychrophilus]
MKKLLLTLLIVLLCHNLAPAWGTFAHRTVTQLAVYALPATMRSYYFRHMPALVNGSAGGNEARERDLTESPRHFIAMDHYGTDPFGIMPKEWEKAAAKYTADTLRKYGTLPWAIMETQTKLTTAFRAADTSAILTLSSELSHLVADAYVPLRTTENYDGQLSKQEGMLALWESKLPERHMGKYKLKNEVGHFEKNPMADIWQVIQESYGFLGATFDLEADITRKYTLQTKYVFSHKYGQTRRAYSDAFADSYHDKVGGMIAFRLKLAPTLIASMWMTAWKDAGSPDLNKLLKRPVSKDEKDQLDNQLSAWKENVLVDQKNLLALEPIKATARPDLINAARAMPTLSADIEAKPATPAPAATPASAPATPTTKVKIKVKPAEGPTVKEKTKPAAKPKAKAKADDGWGSPAGSGW